MVLQTVFTAGINDSQGARLEVGTFLTIVLAIIFGWLLVGIYQRLLENLAFTTLGMNSRSTLHALIIAVVATIIFIAFVNMIDDYEIIPAGTAAGAVEGATEGILEGSGMETNPITSQIAGSTRFGHPIVISPVQFF